MPINPLRRRKLSVRGDAGHSSAVSPISWVDALERRLLMSGSPRSPMAPPAVLREAAHVAAPRADKGKTSVRDVAPPTADLTSTGTMPLALSAEALGAGGIRLNWLPLGLPSSGEIVVFRKALDEPAWTGAAIGEPAFDATSFVDATAQVGVAYEYKVVIYTELGAAPQSKFILAGNAAAATHSRGAVLLVVDATQLDASRDAQGTTLRPALQQYQADLIAEGYRLLTIVAPRVDVPRDLPADSSPAGVAAHFGAWKGEVAALKARIRAVWQNAPDLKSVLLLGHVAVPYSGIVNPDGAFHQDSQGAWPADAYYGVLSKPDALWTDELQAGVAGNVNYNVPGDGKFDQDTLAELGLGTPDELTAFSDVAVGRVDFAMMDFFLDVGHYGPVASPGETRLLATYLAKNHRWRTGEVSVRRQALFEEQFPFGEYYDTNRLTPNVGLDGVKRGTVSPYDPTIDTDVPFPAGTGRPDDHALNDDTWLWLYAGAAGYPSRQTLHFSFYRELRADQYANGVHSGSGDFTRNKNFGAHKAVFNYIYGSYVGDWDRGNTLLRAAIAEPDGLGLASAWGARPNWEQHHMGLGETIGLSLAKTINNFGEREAYGFRDYEGSTRLALMGDPTLREANVPMPSDARTAPAAGGGTTVTWDASPDAAVAGYHVYRASSPAGPFVQLNASLVAGTSFTDPSAAAPGETYYLVRAARLEATPSGSYWNLSLGAASAPAVTAASFLTLPAARHALDVTFSQDVGQSLATGDLVIAGRRYDFATRQLVPATLVAGVDFHLASYDVDARTARIVFDAPGGRVPSGRWTLAFADGTVVNGFGGSVDASYAHAFNFLMGDANGDLRIDFADLVSLAQRYGQSAGSAGAAWGDFNGDGVVNFEDLVTLAQGYGSTL